MRNAKDKKHCKGFDMFKKAAYIIVFLMVLTGISCSGVNRDAGTEASMEQLYAEQGSPVSVRKLAAEDFSVYLKYPTVLSASSESTASALLSDVVRQINVKIGDRVQQDDVILSFSPDHQNLRQAAAAWENVRSSFERSSALFANADISRQDFDTVEMQYEIAQANLKAANDMIYVKAPISGTVTQINVRVTENVRPGTPLFTVSNENGCEARFYVGADEIDLITAGARVFIGDPVDYPLDNPADRLEGRVTQVSLIMDGTKQSFPATAFFNVASNKLISGMGVDLSVETYRNQKAIVVSRRELLKTDAGYTAYIAVADGSTRIEAQSVAVTVGHEQGLRYEIAGGLEEGDMLICDGIQRLSPNTPLNIVDSVLLSRAR
jgi:RND family efflux transporter MFP subunit